MNVRPSLLGVALAALAGVLPASAPAQSIGDAVGDHVKDGVSRSSGPKKKKKKKNERAKKSQKRPSSSGRSHAGTREAAAPAKPPKKDEYPKRVIGKHLRLDPQVGVGYRGWRPQQYPAVDVDTGTYLTGRLELQATFFGIVTLNRGYYESNAIAAPRRTNATVAAKAGSALPKVAVVLGSVSVPFDFIWEPMASYEAYAFEATARPSRPVQIIPRSASKNDDLSDATRFPATSRDLVVESHFETFVVGARYRPDNDVTGVIGDDLRSNVPPFYLGLGYTAYSKPYQLTVGDSTLDTVIFDARFRGGGLAFGVEMPRRAERFFLEARGQVGLGEIELMRDFTVNDVLPDDWLIGYFRGEASLGYLHPLIRAKPTLLLGAVVSGGGATFFAFKTVSREEENAGTPPLNWDLLWGAQLFVVLPL